jgi:hypothetical protein
MVYNLFFEGGQTDLRPSVTITTPEPVNLKVPDLDIIDFFRIKVNKKSGGLVVSAVMLSLTAESTQRGNF